MNDDTDFDRFLGRAWNEHADDAPGVASRLPQAVAAVTHAAQAERLAALIVHVHGEHLGRWHDGLATLDALSRRLQALPTEAAVDRAAAEAALQRQGAALRLAAGDPNALQGLASDAAIAARAVVAGIAAGRDDWPTAIAHWRRALADAAPGLPDGSPALRALAVTGNNLAAALEERASRSADETAAMLEAAAAGLSYWSRAGGWTEVERAHHRLGSCRLAAADAPGAAASARACLALCAEHDAPAFERFFGEALLARASHAAATRDAATIEEGMAAATRARALAATLGADERAWCDAELARLP
ncbi:MAG: hypothetical protein ABI696_00760 [Rubrivivax sp.]